MEGIDLKAIMSSFLFNIVWMKIQGYVEETPNNVI